MRPAEGLLDPRDAAEPDARLVVPDGAAQSGAAIGHGFVDHFPGMHLAGVVSGHGGDVAVQDLIELRGGEVSFSQPIGER